VNPAPFPAWTATIEVAALTWLRTKRSRTLWISLALVALPLIEGVVLRMSPELQKFEVGRVWDLLLIPELLLLAVLTPLYAAASLGDEIDSGTMTYLWARPLPRWTIAAGKLIAMTPIVAVLLVASSAAAMLVARSALPPVMGLVALAIGAVALSIASTGIAMLVPRHSMVVPMAYLLFIDLPIGELPLALQKLSMSYHVRVIAGGSGLGESLIWLFGITALWAAIGLRRLQRFE
jgi:ABC-2 type transport system permease protein